MNFKTYSASRDKITVPTAQESRLVIVMARDLHQVTLKTKAILGCQNQK
jgi:hypothetical protein